MIRCDIAFRLVVKGLRWPKTNPEITRMAGERDWWEAVETFAGHMGRLAMGTPQDGEGPASDSQG